MAIPELSVQQYVELMKKVKDAVVRRQTGDDLPTVRSLCDLLHLTQADLLQVIEDIGLNLNVASMCSAGVAEVACKGDWTVECLNP